jgi:hypothetical protein
MEPLVGEHIGPAEAPYYSSDRVEHCWSGRRGTGENIYTKGKYINQADFLARLDAVLTYFEMSLPREAEEGERRLEIKGFKGPTQG